MCFIYLYFDISIVALVSEGQADVNLSLEVGCRVQL